MRRREFIMLLSGLTAWPVAVDAQPAGKLLRVGTAGVQPRSVSFWKTFERRMAELGYSEGKNYTLEFLNAANTDAFESGYRELAARGVDIIIASGPEISLKWASASSRTIPILMVAIDYDPFARGYVTNMARPTGNITGLFLQQIELTAKRLQLLKSSFPDLEALTVFWDQISTDQWKEAQAVAANLGLRLAGVELHEPPYDYDKAFTQSPPEFRGTLMFLVSPFFFRDRVRQVEFALRNRAISMFGFREWVAEGGLLSFGPSIDGMYRRLAEYVDRIARGAKPADLPIEQPTEFDLSINLKTARALGLTIPPSLLVLAKEVIE
jgi:putative ABC transport system substrate-binding protein